jgi:hypothetical protein
MDSTTESTYTSTTKVTVTLVDTNDWYDWITTIKVKAQGEGIWQYIDPSTPKESLPRLEEPARPSYKQVQEILKESFPQAATTFTDEEREAYKLESSMVVANLNDQY